MGTQAPLIERILRSSTCEGFGCWTFNGRGRVGRKKEYGKIRCGNPPKRNTQSVHRAFYEYYVGPITGTLDHLCGNTLCFNPLHLEDISAEENIRRRDAAASAEDRELNAALEAEAW